MTTTDPTWQEELEETFSCDSNGSLISRYGADAPFSSDKDNVIAFVAKVAAAEYERGKQDGLKECLALEGLIKAVAEAPTEDPEDLEKLRKIGEDRLAAEREAGRRVGIEECIEMIEAGAGRIGRIAGRNFKLVENCLRRMAQRLHWEFLRTEEEKAKDEEEDKRAQEFFEAVLNSLK